MKYHALWLTLLPTLAWAFDSGSNGSYGAINVPADQTVVLQVPEDGVFHATTVTVNGILRFACNSRNTPVTILATGNVNVAYISGSSFAAEILVDGGSGSATNGGAAGCGGFPGGAPQLSGQTLGGAGRGPGGGAACVPTAPATSCTAQNGQFASGTRAYGSTVLMPLVGGSGGGAAVSGSTNFGGGGGGGGAILIASNTAISLPNSNLSRITARGGFGASGAGASGSGGAIRLIAPRVTGNGYLCVAGGDTSSCSNGTATAGGRVRIDTGDRAGVQVQIFGLGAASSIGSLMQVSLPNNPKLEITNVAGTAIPANSGAALVSLPGSAPTTQPISLRATGFTATVPVRLVLTPFNGAQVIVDGEIVPNAQGIGTLTLNAAVPGNSTVAVDAWVR